MTITQKFKIFHETSSKRLTLYIITKEKNKNTFEHEGTAMQGAKYGCGLHVGCKKKKKKYLWCIPQGTTNDVMIS